MKFFLMNCILYSNVPYHNPMSMYLFCKYDHEFLAFIWSKIAADFSVLNLIEIGQ